MRHETLENRVLFRSRAIVPVRTRPRQHIPLRAFHGIPDWILHGR